MQKKILFNITFIWLIMGITGYTNYADAADPANRARQLCHRKCHMDVTSCQMNCGPQGPAGGDDFDWRMCRIDCVIALDPCLARCP